MTKIHVRVKSIEDKIYEYVENHPEEIYIDQNDQLTTEQVDRILKGEIEDVRAGIEEDCSCQSLRSDYDYYWEQMCEELGCTMDDVNDWLESADGFHPYQTLDDSSWRRLLANTDVCITATVWDAEWNFNNWSCGGPVNYSDVKTSLKVLGVNPSEFRKLKVGGSMAGGDSLKGWFPDMPDRDPKIDTQDLWNNLICLYDGVMNFCLGSLENVIAVMESDSKNIIVEKGTEVVFYDFCNGAGITEVELTKDLVIPRKMVQFRNDGSNKFGIQACYGFCSSVWEKGGIRNEK